MRKGQKSAQHEQISKISFYNLAFQVPIEKNRRNDKLNVKTKYKRCFFPYPYYSMTGKSYLELRKKSEKNKKIGIFWLFFLTFRYPNEPLTTNDPVMPNKLVPKSVLWFEAFILIITCPWIPISRKRCGRDRRYKNQLFCPHGLSALIELHFKVIKPFSEVAGLQWPCMLKKTSFRVFDPNFAHF